MWHRPRLLNALADLLYLLAGGALLAMGIVWLVRVPFAPVKQVEVMAPLVHVQAGEIEMALDGVLRGNFVTLSLDVVRVELEKLPWVRRAEVRRRWPAKLEVTLEEENPVARWGEGRGELVNRYGEVFVANLPEGEGRNLPVLLGPATTAGDVVAMYQVLDEMLTPLGLKARQVELSQRMAWQVKLKDGPQLNLGREQTKSPVAQRLQRFVEIYPSMIARRETKPVLVDLRYPNGFALR